jgi:RNA polymerase sigma-70 factor (ECF subfamily)
MGVLRAAFMPSVSTGPALMDDPVLVDLAQRGDREAFGELVGRHQRRVWLVCRQYLGPDEADAAAQDSFLKAYRRLASFDGRAAFTTWLTRIAINTCLDLLRRAKRAGTRIEDDDDGPGDGVLEQLADDTVDPEQRAIERQAVRRLAALEEALPERQREVFRLRFYAELDLEEIARVLDVHVGTVKTQLHRAVHRLRAELEDVR